jgi:deoxycytidine triphosphate deaminase
VILSDRSIKEAIAGGHLGVEPDDRNLLQPPSIDASFEGHLTFQRRAQP